MEFISENVSIDESDGRVSVVIEQTLRGWKKALYITWFFFWTFCGIFFIIALTTEQASNTRIGIVVMLAFWAYYAWKIGKALMWRLRGVEQWRVQDGVLTVKDSINGYGKAHDYFVDNMKKFGVMEIDESSWKWQMSNSIWQIGGERIGFEYRGKRVAIGKGLTHSVAKNLVKKVHSALQKGQSK